MWAPGTPSLDQLMVLLTVVEEGSFTGENVNELIARDANKCGKASPLAGVASAVVHFLDLRGDALLGDCRRPLPVIGPAISWVGASTPSDRVASRPISQRPAGPGGVSVMCTACRAYSPPRQSGRFNRTSLPDSISARTIGSGIPLHPSPARRSLCLADRSPMRQVWRLTTP
jgi:hypothetical protein